jgi:hypothetical protein
MQGRTLVRFLGGRFCWTNLVSLVTLLLYNVASAGELTCLQQETEMRKLVFFFLFSRRPNFSATIRSLQIALRDSFCIST